MAGMVNDNIVFPVLDLVRGEIRRFYNTKKEEENPFDGIPSVTLFREHPKDNAKVIVTSAELRYSNGHWVDVRLDLDDSMKLRGVMQYYYNPTNKLLFMVGISLNYDERGLLTSVPIIKISGTDETP